MSNSNNQRCSKCYQKYSGLKATCYDSSCNREHFFRKNEQLLCVVCLMEEGNIKCQKCRKLITRLEEMGKWRRNVVLADDHTYDINNFGCECRECNHSENKKDKLKRCQGTFSVHYKGGYKAKRGSTQFNQCDLAIPVDGGDFCHHCKGQTETYQQLRTRLDEEQERTFKKFKQAHEKAQNYWNSLSSSEREKECERVVEGLKLGKYWGGEMWEGNKDMEGYGSGWACDGSFWQIKNGKYISDLPHLVPAEIAEEFQQKEIGFCDKSKAIEWLSSQVVRVKKIDNNDNNLPLEIEERERNSETKKIEIVDNNKSNNEVLVIDLKRIKKITLRGNNKLEIEFNSVQKDQNVSHCYSVNQVIISGKVDNNQDLRAIRSYLQKTNKHSLNQRELTEFFNSSSVPTETLKDISRLLKIGGGAVLVFGLLGWLLVVSKRKLKKH